MRSLHKMHKINAYWKGRIFPSSSIFYPPQILDKFGTARLHKKSRSLFTVRPL